MDPDISYPKTEEDSIGTLCHLTWNELVEVFTKLVFVKADRKIELLFLNSNKKKVLFLLLKVYLFSQTLVKL